MHPQLNERGNWSTIRTLLSLMKKIPNDVDNFILLTSTLHPVISNAEQSFLFMTGSRNKNKKMMMQNNSCVTLIMRFTNVVVNIFS
jgi:hypothetical protein